MGDSSHPRTKTWATPRFLQSGTQPLRSKNPQSFQLSGDSQRGTSWETRQQRQPRAKPWRETSLGDKATKTPRAKSWRRQAWETSRQRHLEDKAAAAANFRNQKPSHWEAGTPIASSYLGKNVILIIYFENEIDNHNNVEKMIKFKSKDF